MNELWRNAKLFSEHCKAKLSSVFGRQRERALLWQENVEEWGQGQQVFLFISAHSPIFNTWIIDMPMLAVRKNMQCFYLQTNISIVKEKFSHASDLSPMWVCVSYQRGCWICWTPTKWSCCQDTAGSSKVGLTCVTFSVTLWVRSLTFGALMVVSDVGGEWVFLSAPSEKLSAIRGILLMVLYLLMLESEVEPSRLDFIWLKGPGGLEEIADVLASLVNLIHF